jgi:LysR family glycine cleavage system transcriptional activator
VRSGRGNWPGLVSRELMPERYAPLCSPMLGLKRVADLPKHQLIHCDWQPQALAPAEWPRWFREAGLAPPRGRAMKASGLSFSDETHAILAALGGHGVALLSLTLAAEELRSGALVQPFGPALDTGSYFLATASGRENEAGDSCCVGVDRCAGGELIRLCDVLALGAFVLGAVVQGGFILGACD